MIGSRANRPEVAVYGNKDVARYVNGFAPGTIFAIANAVVVFRFAENVETIRPQGRREWINRTHRPRHMRRARKWAELKELSEAQLIAEHDNLVKDGHVVVGINYYLEEIRHRRQSRVAANMESATKTIRWLTIVITGLTVINAAAAIVNLVH